MSVTITQGADRTIVISGIVDRDGNPLDVTGWSIHAQVRRSKDAPLLAEWVSGTPTGDQGQATPDGDEIRLDVPHAMSSAWTWRAAKWHCEMTEPGLNGRRERIADEPIVVDFEIVREEP